MKINELLVEEQLDELNLKGLGTGLGKIPGAIAGATVQGAKNVWNGAKQGYQAGQNALKPDVTTGNTQNQSNTQGAMSSGSTQPSASEDEINQILQSIEPLDPASKQEIVDRIQAEPTSSVAPSKPVASPTNAQSTVAPSTQSNPFGSMVNNLKSFAPPETTSSGGTLKQTTTGQVHTANPNNPNKPQTPATKTGATAPSQAEIDADRERLMGPDNGNANESKIATFHSKFLKMGI